MGDDSLHMYSFLSNKCGVCLYWSLWLVPCPPSPLQGPLRPVTCSTRHSVRGAWSERLCVPVPDHLRR